MSYFNPRLYAPAQTYPSNQLTLTPDGWEYSEEEPQRLLPEMYLINDRHDAWNFSSLTTFTEIAEDGTELSFGSYFQLSLNKSLSGKRILMLVGGYTSKKDTVLEVLQRTAHKTGNAYDAIICYVYPSGEIPFYIQARKVALVASIEFRKIINSLSANTRIDIAAHSMGALLTLNALNSNVIPRIVNLYLLGGADKQESLNTCYGPGCTPYPRSLKNVEHIYNFVTCHDNTLPYHTFMTGEQTLGRPTNWKELLLSGRITIIDTTQVVSDHIGFLNCNGVFNAITFLSSDDLPFTTRGYELKRDGKLYHQQSPVVCPQTIRQHVSAVTSPIVNGVSNIVDFVVGEKFYNRKFAS